MMNKKKIFIGIGVIILISIFAYFMKTFIKFEPCGYSNYAWGAQKYDCKCKGIKIDTSCKGKNGGGCPDQGDTTACLGIVQGRICYKYLGNKNPEWEEIQCAD